MELQHHENNEIIELIDDARLVSWSIIDCYNALFFQISISMDVNASQIGSRFVRLAIYSIR